MSVVLPLLCEIPMEQENAGEKTPKKQTRKTGWTISGTTIFLCFVLVVITFERFNPPALRSLEGTIVIVDENGDVVPYRSPVVTFFSHYAPGTFRGEVGRKQDLYFDDSGNFGSWIPRYPATLFFHSRNGKYAAVVDIAKGDPTTGLEVILRPRHSVTGRLVDRSGTPLANYDFRLEFMRVSERNFRRRVKIETFESLYSKTDADGFFTVDRLIPGVQYQLRTLLPTENRFSRVTMPILEPEQYQEPFDLGDVSI